MMKRKEDVEEKKHSVCARELVVLRQKGGQKELFCIVAVI
jgi:hypothetical protein